MFRYIVILLNGNTLAVYLRYLFNTVFTGGGGGVSNNTEKKN